MKVECRKNALAFLRFCEKERYQLRLVVLLPDKRRWSALAAVVSMDLLYLPEPLSHVFLSPMVSNLLWGSILRRACVIV